MEKFIPYHHASSCKRSPRRGSNAVTSAITATTERHARLGFSRYQNAAYTEHAAYIEPIATDNESACNVGAKAYVGPCTRAESLYAEVKKVHFGNENAVFPLFYSKYRHPDFLMFYLRKLLAFPVWEFRLMDYWGYPLRSCHDVGDSLDSKCV